MNILITGGSGLLGQYLNIELSRNHTVFSLYNKNIRNCISYNSAQVDIRNTEELIKIFKSFKPDILIHTAAVSSALQASESNARYVYDINVNVTEKIARLCAEMNTRMIYTSTDLVYAGYRDQLLKEDAKLIPASLYAETKLMGEVKIRDTFDNFLILRIALLYGLGLNKSFNHFHRMFLDLRNQIPVRLFTDQFRTPIELGNAAEIINQLIEKDINTEIINLGGNERVSRYQLGEILCEIAGFDKSLLRDIRMDDISGLPKVEDVSMDTGKLKSYQIKQNSIADSIKKIICNNDLKIL